MANIADGFNQGSGIKSDSTSILKVKRMLWPLFKFRNDLMIDGFIEWEIGKLIKKVLKTDTVFLEIGCGDMSLRKYIPEHIFYNALDLELSEFHIIKAMKTRSKINIILASAAEIPAVDNSASLLVSTETLEHIPEIDKAVSEIRRVAMPGAIFICSIPNNFCYKYHKKGPHTGHINNWTYDGFIEYMNSYDFEYVEGHMKGKWIPFPLWMTNTSYQLPVSSNSEYHNTNFFYMFKVNK
jgi:ubiquinone/menaquinone biosynthesis C-methylase UbiE